MASNDAVEVFLSERIRSVVGSRRWLVVADVDQVASAMAAGLISLGVESVLAVGISAGTGPLDPAVPLISVGSSIEGSMMAGIRHAHRVARDLPGWVLEAIDTWDPDREAAVLVPFTFHAGRIAGRATWGARPAEWEALEDKLVADEIWSAAGIEHEPTRVVSLDDTGALERAHRELATASGSVWAGDSRSGWHGGASGVRWVPDDRALRRVAAEMAADHDRVRIMGFLEGVPCSIHGLVVGTGVAALRPCEMIIFADPAAGRFVYAGVGTFWDPAPAVRDEMVNVARSVGRVLADRVGFEGVFTVDGVATRGGFRPTELNARFGGAAAMVGRGRAHLPLFVTGCAAIAGELDGLELAAFEEWTVAGADANRQAQVLLPVPHAGPGEQIGLVHQGGAIRVAADEQEAVVATARWGAGASGGVVMISFTGRVPVGPPIAGLVGPIVSELGRHWPLGVGELVPAYQLGRV